MGAPFGKITISDQKAPVYVATFEGITTDAQFDDYPSQLSKLAHLPHVKAFVFDARNNGTTPPSQRKRMADWMKQHENQIRERTAGCAFVLPSALQRGVLTAILWLQPMACPHTIVGTLEEALAWSAKAVAGSQLNRSRSA
jgi:hypothetical protein